MSPALRFPLPPDFALPIVVESHGWYRLAPFRWTPDAAILQRAETFDTATTIDLTVRQSRAQLIVTSHADLRPLRDEIRQRIRRMLQLDLDLRPFHELCRKTPTHRSAARAKFGRLLCGTTPFEDAVKIIATTNTTWLQTVRMIARLVARFGRTSPSGFQAFPDSGTLASAGAEAIRECGFGYRAAYVAQLAQDFTDGRFDIPQMIGDAPTAAGAMKALQKLPGIGPYGAAHLLALGGRHDFIAVDTEFRRFVRANHFAGRDVSDREMLKVYEPWNEWKYLAYWTELWNEVAPAVDAKKVE